MFDMRVSTLLDLMRVLWAMSPILPDSPRFLGHVPDSPRFSPILVCHFYLVKVKYEMGSPILPDSPRFSPKLSDRISRIVA